MAVCFHTVPGSLPLSLSIPLVCAHLNIYIAPLNYLLRCCSSISSSLPLESSLFLLLHVPNAIPLSPYFSPNALFYCCFPFLSFFFISVSVSLCVSLCIAVSLSLSLSLSPYLSFSLFFATYLNASFPIFPDSYLHPHRLSASFLSFSRSTYIPCSLAPVFFICLSPDTPSFPCYRPLFISLSQSPPPIHLILPYLSVSILPSLLSFHPRISPAAYLQFSNPPPFSLSSRLSPL